MLKDFFGFAEHQEKATYGLGYKLTLPRNSDNFVLIEDNAINFGKPKIIGIEWCVPQYKPSILQQAIISKQSSSKLSTQIQYVEKSVFI